MLEETEPAPSEGACLQIDQREEPAQLNGQDPADDTHIVSYGLRRWVYLSLAAFFFLLGLLGVILPGLPTTPFLLLTSYYLVRSSPRLHAVLLRSRLFGPILTDWQVHGGVRRHVKIKATVAVLIFVGLTVLFAGHSLLPSLAVALLAAMGILVIWRLPEVQAE